MTLTFTAAVANPVLAWGGHIASRDDWGQAASAVSISGSPVHMRLVELDGKGGNQDRSLTSQAVIFPGSITIVKEASPEGARAFDFTAASPLSPAAFTLADDGADLVAPVNNQVFSDLSDFETTYTATEQPENGWSLTSVACSDPTSDSAWSARSAVIMLDEGENVTCTFHNTAKGSVSVTKSASPASLPEPGGSVTFPVTVQNTSPTGAVTITSLNDDVYGDITSATSAMTATTCAVPQVIALGGSYSCSFSAAVSGNAGFTETGVVSASGTDDSGNPVSGNDSATVAITDVLPSVQLAESATPTSVEEAGGDVTFNVVATNPVSAVENVWLTSLLDDVYGDLDGVGTCDVTPAISLGPAESYLCSFTGAVTGNAGDSHSNTITATAEDDDGNTATDTDDATVTITDVLPAITVEKTASAATVAPGGAVTYRYRVANGGVEPLRDVSVADDKCAPVTFAAGDADDDEDLDTKEVWTFTCATELAATTTNTATARGADDEGNLAEATDTVSVTVVAPVVADTATVIDRPDTAVVTEVRGVQFARTGLATGMLLTIATALVCVGETMRRSGRPRG